ncbi:MAG: hypothetical protein KJZ69_01865 [Phycisphaerales bacterium]|nr:hypothetical protein [Phycisphaerales bacterium]
MSTSTRDIESTRITRRRGATAPNIVIREACDRDGIVLGHLVASHDGTPEGIVAAARRATARMFDAFVDACNVNSRIIATDASGRPRWGVSPNLAVIEELAVA